MTDHMGSVYRYDTLGCRCDACRAANARKHRDIRARRQNSNRPRDRWAETEPHDGPEADPRWREDAACRGTDPGLWFPPQSVTLSAEVRAICGGCPVRTECQEYAIVTVQTHGIWGGLTRRDLEAARRRRRAA
ncbi:MAG TPA: WhiB family transcriptional regulator [Aquihabitans sp.]|jgi:WhiB family redox-sensing transcriptional regulator|nr:WhiB family transcriptional regulator [Aquihabitans sp.]